MASNQMQKFWALVNTLIGAALSWTFAIYYISDTERREYTFGRTWTDYWSGLTLKSDPIGSLLASFCLTTTAAVLATIGAIMIAVGKPGLVKAALVFNVLCLLLAGSAFIYFMEISVTVGGLTFHSGESLDLQWGVGCNIGATINYFFAIINTCMFLKCLGQTPTTQAGGTATKAPQPTEMPINNV